jgi:hypothetical protein
MVTLTQAAAGSTHSPVFLLFPIDIGYALQPYVHVPNAFDIDGDSLAYELVVPMAGTAELVPNYQFPDQISPSADNKVVFNALTGEFNWTSPITPGDYCIAILAKSYHNGVLIEQVRRDMVIFIQSFVNHPPTIVLNPEFNSADIVEVTVGQTVTIAVSATDPDAGQTLTLSASGGPFDPIFQENATFVSTGNTGVFNWNITQEYGREEPYQIVFQAKDDYLGNGMASARIVRFRVLESVGIEQLRANSFLQIFPNPATESILLKVPENTKAEWLQVFDNRGQLQISQKASDFMEITLAELPSGMYFIKLQTADGQAYRGKVLKL